jgi:hypothetical protein
MLNINDCNVAKLLFLLYNTSFSEIILLRKRKYLNIIT